MAAIARVMTPLAALAALKLSVEKAGGTLTEVKCYGEPFGPADRGTSDIKYMFIDGICIKVIPMKVPS